MFFLQIDTAARYSILDTRCPETNTAPDTQSRIGNQASGIRSNSGLCNLLPGSGCFLRGSLWLTVAYDSIFEGVENLKNFIEFDDLEHAFDFRTDRYDFQITAQGPALFGEKQYGAET